MYSLSLHLVIFSLFPIIFTTPFLNTILIAVTFQHINGMAQIKRAKHGVVDMDFVLGVGGYDLDR